MELLIIGGVRFWRFFFILIFYWLGVVATVLTENALGEKILIKSAHENERPTADSKKCLAIGRSKAAAKKKKWAWSLQIGPKNLKSVGDGQKAPLIESLKSCTTKAKKFELYLKKLQRDQEKCLILDLLKTCNFNQKTTPQPSKSFTNQNPLTPPDTIAIYFRYHKLLILTL